MLAKHSHPITLDMTSQVAVGSVPPNSSQKLLLMEESPWKAADFEITLLQRVQSATSAGRYSEQRLANS